MQSNRSEKQSNSKKELQFSNSKWKPLTTLYSGVAALIFCVILAATTTLINWHQTLGAEMAETSQSLAQLFDKSVEGLIDTIDVSLLYASHQIGEHHSSRESRGKSINTSLALLEKRVTPKAHFVVINKHGNLIYRNNLPHAHVKITDRDYFIKLRKDQMAGLIINRPFVERVTGKWVWMFARRIEKPDGTFDGVVLSTIYIDEMRKIFEKLKLGSNNQVSIRNADFRFITSYPNEFHVIGTTNGKKSFTKALKANPDTGTYSSDTGGIDGNEHTFSYHRNKKYGYLINVGISNEAMFTGWYKSVWITIALIAALILASIWFLLLITRAWRRQEASLITLSNSEEKLASAQNYARLGHWEVRKDGRRFWSEHMYDLFGIPHNSPDREEFLGQVINPEDLARVKSSINDALVNGAEHFVNFKIQRFDTSEERWVNCRGKPVFGADGNIERVIGFVQDITEHEQTKLALQKSESRLEEVAHQSRTFVWEIDTDGLYTYVSDVVLDVIGYSPQELICKKHYYDFHPEEGREDFIRATREIIAKRKKVFDFTAPAKSKDGSLVWLATTAAPMLDKHGSFIGYRGSDREITDRKKFEMELLASRNRLEKLTSQLINAQEAERKHLARELHDELGQKFTTLNLQFHQLIKHVNSSEADHVFESISNEISTLINQVRTMSGSLRPPDLDYFGLEISLNNLLRKQFEGSNVDYALEYVGLPKKLPEQLEITIYRIIQEAVTNIVRHASANRIVIEANSDESKREIEIIIRDNGAGFDTNSVDSPKLGFGLMGMVERVHLLNGEIEFFSKLGAGTRIQVLIPLNENIFV